MSGSDGLSRRGRGNCENTGQIQTCGHEERYDISRRFCLVMCRRHPSAVGSFMGIGGPTRERLCLPRCRGGVGAMRSPFCLLENSRQEFSANASFRRKEMPVRFYAMEKLPDDSGHDYHGNDPASFGDAKAILSGIVYMYRSGVNIVEREICQGLYKGKMAEIVTRRR